jgi:hypothetical protein
MVSLAATNCNDRLTENGFVLIPGGVGAETVRKLIRAVDEAGAAGRRKQGSVYAIRNLLEAVPIVGDFVRSLECRRLVEPILGVDCFAVRGLLFDKTPDANWNVPWHQDLSIAVRERRDVERFGPWTTKEGVPHVQPPVAVLENMLTLRLHLDSCGPDNGPLRVIAGSHGNGRLSGAEIDALRACTTEVELSASPGDILVMRPLLLHSSSSAKSPNHRRVVHIEFAAEALPDGLEWHTSCTP